MGVSGIGGQDPAARVPLSAADVSPRGTPPSPGPRTADTVRDTAPAARAGPGPSEELKQIAANGNKPRPVVTSSGVKMRLDEASKRIVAQITDETNEVIKQIPSEEMLKIVTKIRQLYGLLFDRKV